MTYPTFSIIMPMFDSGKTIVGSVNSVRSQTETDWELIIIDDCSTDSSVDIVREIQTVDQRIKLLKTNVNSGPGVARNLGLNEANGNYICFLDSDDEWLPSKLETQKKYMIENDVAFCSTEFFVRSKNDKQVRKSLPSTVSYKDLLKENVIGCLTVCYDVSKVGKRIMPVLRKRQDYALWLQILRDGWECHIINQPLAIYNIRKGSVSSKPLSNIYFQFSMFRTILMMPRRAALYYVIVNIVFKIIRIIKMRK
jgi:teichuronic acid biosynthesis glycosyltransferase TuaG